MLTTQTSQPAQPAKVAELKRSSRQAARAVDQSQRAMDTVHSSVLQQAEAAGTIESSLQPLRWGKRVHVNRVRGHKQVAKSADRFQGWTVSGGILKPVASKQAPATGGRAAAAQGRAFRVEPGLFKPAPPADPTAASVEPLLLAAPAAKVPEEIAAAFIPRHSRKKVSTRNVPVAVLCICISDQDELSLTGLCCVSYHAVPDDFLLLIVSKGCYSGYLCQSLMFMHPCGWHPYIHVLLLCRAKFREALLSDRVHQPESRELQVVTCNTAQETSDVCEFLSDLLAA